MLYILVLIFFVLLALVCHEKKQNNNALPKENEIIVPWCNILIIFRKAHSPIQNPTILVGVLNSTSGCAPRDNYPVLFGGRPKVACQRWGWFCCFPLTRGKTVKMCHCTKRHRTRFSPLAQWPEERTTALAGADARKSVAPSLDNGFQHCRWGPFPAEWQPQPASKC